MFSRLGKLAFAYLMTMGKSRPDPVKPGRDYFEIQHFQNGVDLTGGELLCIR